MFHSKLCVSSNAIGTLHFVKDLLGNNSLAVKATLNFYRYQHVLSSNNVQNAQHHWTFKKMANVSINQFDIDMLFRNGFTTVT